MLAWHHARRLIGAGYGELGPAEDRAYRGGGRRLAGKHAQQHDRSFGSVYQTRACSDPIRVGRALDRTASRSKDIA
jgi:hypothetical protein